MWRPQVQQRSFGWLTAGEPLYVCGQHVKLLILRLFTVTGPGCRRRMGSTQQQTTTTINTNNVVCWLRCQRLWTCDVSGKYHERNVCAVHQPLSTFTCKNNVMEERHLHRYFVYYCYFFFCNSVECDVKRVIGMRNILYCLVGETLFKIPKKRTYLDWLIATTVF